MRPTLQLFALSDLPLVEPGDDIAGLILAAMASAELRIEAGDVLVLAQKIISKAENRYVYLNEVEAGEDARALALQADKDPRQMQLLLDQSKAVIRACPGVVIVEHKLGYVHANAGMDRSNIASEDDNPRLLLLPEDPDASAAALRRELDRRCGCAPQIIINDSAGRAWRNGTLGFAIGTAGFAALDNRIGEPDLFGRELEVTEVAVADELAAAASFVMGQGNEAIPVVLIRGARLRPSDAGSSCLLRPAEKDLFR